MKKKVLTPEALALIVGGDPVATDTPATEPVASTETIIEPAAAPPEEKPQPTVEEITKPLIEAHALEISQLQDGFAAERATLEAKVTEVEASMAGLKEIVAGQVSRMRIGLKLAAVDMTTWTPAALVTEFENISDAFMKAIPVGSVVPKETSNVQKDKAIADSHDVSAFKSLGF